MTSPTDGGSSKQTKDAIRSTTQVLGEEEGDVGEPSLLSLHTHSCVCVRYQGALWTKRKVAPASLAVMKEGLDLELDTVNYMPLILYMDVKTSLHRGYMFWAGIFSEVEYFHWRRVGKQTLVWCKTWYSTCLREVSATFCPQNFCSVVKVWAFYTEGTMWLILSTAWRCFFGYC